MPEFDIIKHYFAGTALSREDVILGIGDDAAILQPPANKQLAISTDTLISDVHFPVQTSAYDIGYKSLAVNLSDLAAMGAEPAWVSLAISLPDEDDVWLDMFMQGFNSLSKKFNLCLIGGDTTRGKLSITISVIGFVDATKALRRDKAMPGDAIYVTGTLGDARFGLQALQQQIKSDDDIDYCIARLNRPTPRVEAGQLLTEVGACAIDLSDGLLSDLGHICNASDCGAEIQLESVPLSKQLLTCMNQTPDWHTILNAGDDYELCFTVKQKDIPQMESLLSGVVSFSRIGVITQQKQIDCLYNNQVFSDIPSTGYDHFEK